jgi:hypothetical protein
MVEKFESDATEVKDDSVLEFVDDDGCPEWPFQPKYEMNAWDASKGRIR